MDPQGSPHAIVLQKKAGTAEVNYLSAPKAARFWESCHYLCPSPPTTYPDSQYSKHLFILLFPQINVVMILIIACLAIASYKIKYFSDSREGLPGTTGQQLLKFSVFTFFPHPSLPIGHTAYCGKASVVWICCHQSGRSGQLEELPEQTPPLWTILNLRGLLSKSLSSLLQSKETRQSTDFPIPGIG